MKRLVALILTVGLVACSAGDTSSNITASTVVGSPSSSTTTTAAKASTTSTTSPPTAEIEGNWASLPLVVYDDWGGMALGWWDGTQWVQVDEDTSLPVSGSESYQVAVLGSSEIVEGSAPTNSGCDAVRPEGLPGVQLSDGDALHTTVSDGTGGERSVSGVAISAPWDIQPRPAVAGEWHPDLENLAFQLLGERGFVTDSINHVQSVDADLDGDGALETILVIEATHLANSASGVYSMVFVVFPSFGEALVIAELVIPPNEEGFPESYRISAVSDLSGDGVMEVVVSGLAWESSWVAVYEYAEGLFHRRISAGCGV